MTRDHEHKFGAIARTGAELVTLPPLQGPDTDRLGTLWLVAGGASGLVGKCREAAVEDPAQFRHLMLKRSSVSTITASALSISYGGVPITPTALPGAADECTVALPYNGEPLQLDAFAVTHPSADICLELTLLVVAQPPSERSDFEDVVSKLVTDGQFDEGNLSPKVLPATLTFGLFIIGVAAGYYAYRQFARAFCKGGSRCPDDALLRSTAINVGQDAILEAEPSMSLEALLDLRSQLISAPNNH